MFFLAFNTSAIFAAQAEQGLEDIYLRGSWQNEEDFFCNFQNNYNNNYTSAL